MRCRAGLFAAFHRAPKMSHRLRCGRGAAPLLLAAAMTFSGCGSGSATGSGGGGTTTTPDMGTLAAVSDSSQFTLMNAASGMMLGISGASQSAGTSVVQESSTSASSDADWHFIPMNNSQYNIENMLTHQLLGVQNASTTAGAQVLQWPDNGTSDHLWAFYQLTDGNYLIKNVNSSLYLEDANSGMTSSATIDQGVRATSGSGCTCQEWKLTSTGSSPYPAPDSVNVTYTSAGDSSSIGIHDPAMLKAGSIYYLYSTPDQLPRRGLRPVVASFVGQHLHRRRG
jgi:Ricin-type beta-trefoil lectin domain-like